MRTAVSVAFCISGHADSDALILDPYDNWQDLADGTWAIAVASNSR